MTFIRLPFWLTDTFNCICLNLTCKFIDLIKEPKKNNGLVKALGGLNRGGPRCYFREEVQDTLVLVGLLPHQWPESRGKIYALPKPEVNCISKSKERKRYESGTKVNLVTTVDESSVVYIQALPGNPYDGHILTETLEQAAS